MLWQRLIGRGVLKATVTNPADPRLRAYAFCGRSVGSAALVLINLSPNETLCAYPPEIVIPGSSRLEFVLSPVSGAGGEGVTAPAAALNGVTLALQTNGSLPAMPGVAVPVDELISLPPLSVVLTTLVTDADACGGPPPP